MNCCRSWRVLVAALALSACASDPPLPDDGFVDVPGGRVAFRVIGAEDGVPLLVVHGGPGGTGCSYASAMSGVAASRPVVIYDQLGSGNSDRMTDLERDAVLSRFVAEVTAIREQLGLERVHLLGHSWGAAVALEYLLEGDAEGVLSVTFAGPLLSTPRWLEDANALVERLPEDARHAIESASNNGDYATEEFAAANSVFESEFGMRSPRVPGRFPACESTPVRFNVDLYEYMWGPSEFVSTGTLRDYDRADRLGELDLPVLFVIGEYDEVRPGTAKQFQSQVPGAELRVIPDAAHFIQADQPQLFNRAIAEFLDTVEKGR